MEVRRAPWCQNVSNKVKEYMSIIRWFIDSTSCLCMDGTYCLQDPDHEEEATEVLCAPLRRRVQKCEGRMETSYVMRVMFTYI